MNTLLEIALWAALNLFLFVCIQRKLLLVSILQRQQLIVYKRKAPQLKLKERDRLFWILVSKIWSDRKEHLVIVKRIAP